MDTTFYLCHPKYIYDKYTDYQGIEITRGD